MRRTGCPFAMLVPQSPRTKRNVQVANCDGSGRSSSSAARWSARCSAVLLGPSIISTLLGGAVGAEHHLDGVAGNEMQEQERQYDDAADDGDSRHEALSQPGKHRREFRAAVPAPAESSRG